MPQRHSKNNNDLAFFTYDEKRKLGYGTQKERLGKDSIKPFDTCSLCLKPFLDPVSCPKGHVFCRECILECLLSQKRDIHRRLAAHAAQEQHRRDGEEETASARRARDLEAFDRQNHRAVPPPRHDGHHDAADRRGGFHGANSVRVTSYEEEALRDMRAFWLPSATPAAAARADLPSSTTVCPEGKERLRMKSLFSIRPTVEEEEESRNPNRDPRRRSSFDRTYVCPGCRATLTNTMSLVVLSACGHVFCRRCSDTFILAADKTCLSCGTDCKGKQLIPLVKGGTGFSAHGDRLEAQDFKHLGSGSGLGLVRPAMKT